MERHLTIYYTSDIHGCFSPVRYATGERTPSGLANCLSQFQKDGNTLIIDGGDTLQGSPLTYYLSHEIHDVTTLPAQLLNLGGYDFVTLGNHDFDYGKEVIERYLDSLHAVCLCANVEGIRGVQKTAVVTMENGLLVGLTGIITPFVTQFETPENMAGITVTDAFAAAWQALSELRRKQVDLTICIYHGGFEADVKTGKTLSQDGGKSGLAHLPRAGLRRSSRRAPAHGGGKPSNRRHLHLPAAGKSSEIHPHEHNRRSRQRPCRFPSGSGRRSAVSCGNGGNRALRKSS